MTIDGVERCRCGCCDVPDNGPCSTPVQGGNGRCVYCDHSLSCHHDGRGRAKTKWKKELT